MWSDFRYALRQGKRSKGLIAVVILLLGVGIGANTLIFSFINAAILKPLPVRDPQNLFLIEKNRVRQVRPDTGFFYGVYAKIQARKDLFPAAVASEEWNDISFQPLQADDRTKLVSTAIVSPNYFSALGVDAIRGRSLTPADAKTTSGIPVVISEQFWKSQLNGSRNVLGRKLRIKNFPFEIVGVLPKEFHGLNIDRVPDVWLPISAARILTGYAVFHVGGRNTPLGFQVLVRLAPGVTPAAASTAIFRTLHEADIAAWRRAVSQRVAAGQMTQANANGFFQFETEYRIKLRSASHGLSHMRQKFSAALYVLMGAAGLLLLAVCASVSGMLLAQAEQRKREIAIRIAVGARPWQLLRQTFVESLLWTIPSAGLAILFFYAISPVLLGMLPEVRGWMPMFAAPQVLNISVDRRVVLFVVAVCLLTIFLSGLGAAWRSARTNVVEDLKQHRRKGLGVFSGVLMVGIQVAISVILVAGAVLMLKTFWTLQHLNPGFDEAHIVEVDLNPQVGGYSSARAKTFLREIRQEIASLPGVRSAASAWAGVMHGIGIKMTLTPEGQVFSKKTFLNTSVNNVTTSYFRTMGIPLLAGRSLEKSDRGHNPQPIVVNTAFVKKFFANRDPIGKAMVTGTNGNKAPNFSIVGVVGTAKYRSLKETKLATAYGLGGGSVLYARTFGDPKPLLAEIRKLIHTRDPQMPIVASAALEQEVANSLWQERILTLLSGFFAIIALALAAAGIFGTLAYSVAARTREIGIRMAIGAQSRDIIRTVCGRLFAGIVAGLVCGTIAAAVLLQISQKLFFGIQGFDAPAFAITIACILLCGSLAALLPAYRAINTDPVSAMRLE
ncbi:MAG: ADOP family duplicated permease [Candidatus Acidiferrales bacterium]